MVDDGERTEEDEENDRDFASYKDLHVIDIGSGDTLQRVRIDLPGEIGDIVVDQNELFVGAFDEDKVAVLRFAGSDV